MSNKEYYVREQPNRGGRSATAGVRPAGGPRLFAQAVSTVIGGDVPARGLPPSERSHPGDSGKAYDVSVPKASAAEWMPRETRPSLEDDPVLPPDGVVVAKSLGAGKTLYTMMSKPSVDAAKPGKASTPSRKGRGKFGGDDFRDHREVRPPPPEPTIKLATKPEVDPDFDRDGVAFNVPAAASASAVMKAAPRGGRGGRQGPSGRADSDAPPNQSRKPQVDRETEGGQAPADVKGRGTVGKSLKSEVPSPTEPSPSIPPPNPPSNLTLQYTGPMPWGELPPQDIGKFFSGKSLEQLLSHATEWETGLKAALACRQATSVPQGTAPPHDAAILAFRHALSAVYTAVLLNDAVLGRQHNVEQKVWQLYYCDIQDTKTQLARYKGSAGPTPPPTGGKAILNPNLVKSRAKLDRLIRGAEATFSDVIDRLWKSYNLPSSLSKLHCTMPASLWFRGLSGAAACIADDRKRHATKALKPQKASPSAIEKAIDSVHRFVIALGDLSRYKEHVVDGPKRTAALKDALDLYDIALGLQPSGKAHSQASVVFGNAQSVFLALYHLCRALGALEPVNVREQLHGALDKNRQDWERWGVAEVQYHADKPPLWRLPPVTFRHVPTPSSTSPQPNPVAEGQPVTPQAVPVVTRIQGMSPLTPPAASLPAAVGLSYHPFFRAFGRCAGLLVTRTNVDDFQPTLALCVLQLESLLRTWPHNTPAEPDTRTPATFPSPWPADWFESSDQPDFLCVCTDVEEGDPLTELLCHTVTLCVFLICLTDHQLGKKATTTHATTAEPVSDLTNNALSLAFGVVGAIMKNCLDAHGRVRWLASVTIFTEFLRCNSRFNQYAVPSEAFYSQLAKLLNVVRPTVGDCVARFVELSKACIPPPALGATSAVATPTVDAEVDETQNDESASSKTDSTTSVGDLSSREESELTSSLSSDDESSSSGSEDESSVGDERDVSAGASDGQNPSPDIVPMVAPPSPEFPSQTSIPVPTPLAFPTVATESPVPPQSSPTPLKQRPWKRDDVLHCVSDVVLLEDFELAGFEPYAIVASSRCDDVSALRVRFGIAGQCSLQHHIERCRSSFDASSSFVADTWIRPMEVRALRLWRFGLDEAGRCISDSTLEDGMYYHKDAGVFTTSPSKPSAAEVDRWCDASLVSGAKLANTASMAGSIHCVVCRTASATATGACKFCGADVGTGISAGDEADLITLDDEDVTGVDPDAPATATSGARKGVLKVDVAKVKTSSKVPKQAVGVKSGEDGEFDEDYNRQMTVVPRKAPNKRSNKKYDAALAAQLFGLKEDTTFHKRKAVEQSAGGVKGKKPSPYVNIKGPKPLIVLDAPNIAMRYGKGKQFKSAALNVVIVYYQRRGHKVVAFLPESYLDADRISGLRRAEKLGHETNVSKLPDDVPALQSLVDKGLLHLTPSHDYDDSYTIMYAQRHDGCVVTNDRYRDYVDKLPPDSKEDARDWLKSHCVSFTFVGEEYLPNPDFVFPPPQLPSETGGDHRGMFESSAPIFAVSAPLSAADAAAMSSPQAVVPSSSGGVAWGEIPSELPAWLATPSTSAGDAIIPDLMRMLGLDEPASNPGGASLLELESSLLGQQNVGGGSGRPFRPPGL